MKNADPKVVGAVATVIIVLCVIMVLRSLGVGQNNTPPPIATGMPTSLSSGATGGASMSLPGTPPGTASGGGMAPGMGGGTALPTSGGGGTTLPTPGAGGSGNMAPMPNMPK